ncbi:hypothetical protein RhiXN_10841 [Rhizoctonia solani]|uniref:VWFA domain-containing protein n=1 Tax=Rhizoctonia solani TaxID=456999 RepID=A0A8H8T1W4_9AGAM|nr:uncharacterized protein RhiXN_10841 [Rhizoctonia solani]QRW25764.1 hypothetical protein RhiXN_10841 [Rhizoctonia solani]
MHPDPKRAKDWISHRLKWARSDPYSREQQADFAKWYAFGIWGDALCPGFEHEATATAAANPSYCNLPIFHQPHSLHVTPPNGYVSSDGHCFDCSNPARLQQAYHVVFVIDSSGSMDSGDRTPLSNTPVTTLLRGRCNNRYGAVLSALHSFWSTRETGNPNTQPRQDAYSVITFNNAPTTRVANDLSSTIDQLLSRLLRISASGGTNFNAALSHARTLIGTHWNNNRQASFQYS